MDKKNNGSPTGQHRIEIAGKSYDLKFDHRKVSLAEQLLGGSLLGYTGGGITYNLIVGLVLLENQHGVSSQEDVANLMDIEGGAQKIDDAIVATVIDFFRKHYPVMEPQLRRVVRKQEASIKAESTGKD